MKSIHNFIDPIYHVIDGMNYHIRSAFPPRSQVQGTRGRPTAHAPGFVRANDVRVPLDLYWVHGLGLPLVVRRGAAAEK
jgi:hypothetical protein